MFAILTRLIPALGDAWARDDIPVWLFVLIALHDARRDPFVPASRLGAIWFVARRWRWLRSEGGPYSELLHGTPTRFA